MKFVDITGKRYGKLTVIRKHGHNEKGNRITWECLCDCGNTAIVTGIYLGRRTNSCGCMSSRATASERNSTHGMSKTRIYRVWASMLERCNTPSTDSYRLYGARGIKVCDRWKSFEHFFEDMGDTYKEGLSIERVDVNGDYCPENCTWIEKSKQAINKRTTNKFMHDGEYVSLKTMCKIYNAPYQTMLNRINAGMEIYEALAAPVKNYKKKVD
jgi:hypothetical protein